MVRHHQNVDKADQLVLVPRLLNRIRKAGDRVVVYQRVHHLDVGPHQLAEVDRVAHHNSVAERAHQVPDQSRVVQAVLHHAEKTQEVLHQENAGTLYHPGVVAHGLHHREDDQGLLPPEGGLGHRHLEKGLVHHLPENARVLHHLGGEVGVLPLPRLSVKDLGHLGDEDVAQGRLQLGEKILDLRHRHGGEKGQEVLREENLEILLLLAEIARGQHQEAVLGLL